jgi:hypothetical protein
MRLIWVQTLDQNYMQWNRNWAAVAASIVGLHPFVN